jgi:glycosyltransferase involved in cell wall biosynthesis
MRVAAMVRPRTPRRRPVATTQLMADLRKTLGGKVEVVTFGCDVNALKSLGVDVQGFTHHGVLTRSDVADLMRTCDVFVDLSIYQAFGRSGLEAMACGAVPVLPRVGGAAEYATNGTDALLVDATEALAAISALSRDRGRLAALSAAGATTAGRFDLASSARSIAATLGAFTAR